MAIFISFCIYNQQILICNTNVFLLLLSSVIINVLWFIRICASNSKKMWTNLSFLINSAVLDNYFHLKQSAKIKWTSGFYRIQLSQVFLELWDNMYNIIAQNNIKARYFQNPPFWEFPKNPQGTYYLKIL